MKCAVVYISIHHKNTKKIAKKISDVLDADLFDLEKFEPEVSQYDVIGFGSGIYFWRHHRKLLDFVRSLPKMRKRAFIFSTAGIAPKSNHRSLRNLLKERDFEILGEFICKGYDTYGILKYIGGINKGRPNERDMKRAENFAEYIKSLFQGRS